MLTPGGGGIALLFPLFILFDGLLPELIEAEELIVLVLKFPEFCCF